MKNVMVTLIMTVLLTGTVLAGDPVEATVVTAARLFQPAGVSGSVMPPALPVMAAAKGSFSQQLHKWTGYGTLVLAAVTAFSDKHSDLHCNAAYGTAGLGLITTLNGFMRVGKYINYRSSWINAENRHWLLGATGALLCTASVISADSGGLGGHSGLGMAGGILMTAAVIDYKF